MRVVSGRLSVDSAPQVCHFITLPECAGRLHVQEGFRLLASVRPLNPMDTFSVCIGSFPSAHAKLYMTYVVCPKPYTSYWGEDAYPQG